MSHKKKHSAPIPPGNQPHSGPADTEVPPGNKGKGQGEVTSAQEQDPKRPFGDYEGTALHAIQEPGGKQGPNR